MGRVLKTQWMGCCEWSHMPIVLVATLQCTLQLEVYDNGNDPSSTSKALYIYLKNEDGSHVLLYMLSSNMALPCLSHANMAFDTQVGY